MAPKDITDEGDWLRLNKIFADHTILEKAWHAKPRARNLSAKTADRSVKAGEEGGGRKKD